MGFTWRDNSIGFNLRRTVQCAPGAASASSFPFSYVGSYMQFSLEKITSIIHLLLLT